MSKLLALVPLLLPALALAQDKAPADRLRDTVRGAVQWIASTRGPVFARDSIPCRRTAVVKAGARIRRHGIDVPSKGPQPCDNGSD